jgi:hypothetical protein
MHPWEERFDAASGRTYYANLQTGASVWDKPNVVAPSTTPQPMPSPAPQAVHASSMQPSSHPQQPVQGRAPTRALLTAIVCQRVACNFAHACRLTTAIFISFQLTHVPQLEPPQQLCVAGLLRCRPYGSGKVTTARHSMISIPSTAGFLSKRSSRVRRNSKFKTSFGDLTSAA